MDHSSHNDDAHLTRSFFMQKTSVSGELIFKKKLKRPLQLAGPKCVSHFRIRGFKTWAPEYLSSILNNKIDRQNYSIKVMVGDDEFSAIIEPHIFLYSEWTDIINHIKNVIFHVVKSKNHVFFNYINGGGMLYFKILNPKIQIMFGEALCNFFSFTSKWWYNHSYGKNVFFFKNSFRNFRADHIGVSVNFAAGQNLEDNVEIIAMIGTEQVGFMESFDITIISKPEMLHLRTDILTELEVKFVNLTTGVVFPSIHSHEFSEEIYVSMSFDNAF